MKTTRRYKTPLWKKLLDRIANYFHYSEYKYISECIQKLYEQYDLSYPWFDGIKLPMVKKDFVKPVSLKMIKTKPMQRPEGIFFELVYGQTEAFKPGGIGHVFGKGFYIVDENGEKVFFKEEPKKYRKLHLKYAQNNINY